MLVCYKDPEARCPAPGGRGSPTPERSGPPSSSSTSSNRPRPRSCPAGRGRSWSGTVCTRQRTWRSRSCSSCKSPPRTGAGHTESQSHPVVTCEKIWGSHCSKLTCRYFWQSVMASENSPDQVFRGEPSMSSLILDLHIQRFCSLLAFCIFCIGCNALITWNRPTGLLKMPSPPLR